MQKRLVLGSTSPFRKAILDKLGLPFDCDKPEVDETRRPEESAEALVARLAEAKARAVAARHDNALVIGSDQVAVVKGEILGKPHTHDKAVAQLTAASGEVVTFYTGLALVNSDTGNAQIVVEPFEVTFRELTQPQIQGYLQAEQPYNCAGSFKSEGLGIMLFDRLSGRDPNTLIGLPMITLGEMLAAEGVDVLALQATGENTVSDQHPLSQEQLDQIRTEFDFFDRDNNGQIDLPEFIEMLTVLSPKTKANRVEEAFALLDTDGNGQISFDEFVDWWQQCWWEY